MPSAPAPTEPTGAERPAQLGDTPAEEVAAAGTAGTAAMPAAEPVGQSAAGAVDAASTGSTFAPPSPSTSTADTQPVSYAVKRWEAQPSGPEAGQPFTPPAPPSTQQAPTVPIAPPPVPPGDYPYGSAQGDTVAFGAAAPGAAMPQTNEGGTYVPYSTDAARHLESSKGGRPWLIPSIIVGAVALLVVGGVTAFLLLNGQRTANPAGGTTPTSQATTNVACSDLLSKLEANGPGQDNEETLRGIICKSNDEQITAWRELDTEILKGTRTGQALDENIQAVMDLRNKGMYAVPENKSIEFGDVVLSGDKATAETVEVWTVTFYSKSDNRVVLPPQGPDTLKETYHFVKVDGKWLISSVDIEQNEPPITPGGTDS